MEWDRFRREFLNEELLKSLGLTANALVNEIFAGEMRKGS